MIRGKVCRISLSSLAMDFFYLCNPFYISLDTGVLWSMIWEMPQDKLSGNVLTIKYTDHSSSPQPEKPASLQPELILIFEPEMGTQQESWAIKSCQKHETPLGIAMALGETPITGSLPFSFRKHVHPGCIILSSLTALLEQEPRDRTSSIHSLCCNDHMKMLIRLKQHC